MLSKINSITLNGIEAIECEVEVDIASRGFAGFNIVGLPDAAVRESVDRIHAALANCGYQFPKHRTLVNLAPADIRKEGPSLDLPIALGLLLADGQITWELPSKYLIIGELALDGRIRPVKGVLSSALLAAKRNYRGLIVSRENVDEAAIVESIEAIGVSSLTEAVGFLTARLPLEPTRVNTEAIFNQVAKYEIDF
jgi:magnesium chelatase family protein